MFPYCDNARVEIRPAVSTQDVACVRDLWREYWESFGLPLDFQGFAQELANLPGAYAAEGGVILLALHLNEPVGAIALRRLDAVSGEVKRLYLRPDFRGRGWGKRLLQAIIDQARALGYQRLFADTLPVMADALSMYERIGFARIPAYSDAPTPGAIYLKLELVSLCSPTPAGDL
jgi:putative acetyltransferase